MTVDEALNFFGDRIEDCKDLQKICLRSIDAGDVLAAEVQNLQEELQSAESAVNDLMDVGQREWQPIETAPKDRPILAWCESDCKNPACAYSSNAAEGTRNLCLYHGHAEGMGSVGAGYAILEWGGSWDDRTYEEPNAGWMPDWWFRYGAEFEEAANPTHWMPLPEPPREGTKRPELGVSSTGYYTMSKRGGENGEGLD